ncbi:MAG: hypothetical protein FD174_500 [Geobacteraceae bacterium]|nr:MAG: hypothetical protein FD174_500 [Geobacteraceae bacterium]
MLTMQEVKNHYFFTEENAETLKSLLPLAEANGDLFMEEFYDGDPGLPTPEEIKSVEMYELFGAIMVGISPFVLFWILNKIFPVFSYRDTR